METEKFELREIQESNPEIDCKLCYRPAQCPEDAPGHVDLGPLYEYGVCRAHHFCLIFSSGLEQKVEEEEGIKGFAPDDIVKEWKRGSYLKCTYCKKKYATIGCIAPGCRKCYHLPCGIENGSLQQFYGNFSSFCFDHRPYQEPTTKPGSKKSRECGICLDNLNPKSYQNLWTPCCGGWFHRGCMRKMAQTAGMHFFKCPLCNNSTEFTEEMLKFGIYVPDQDAKWETEDGGFQDLLIRPEACDAEVCLCPQGRSTDEEDTKWETVICVACGSKGIHIECGGLNFDRPRWKCDMCRDVLSKIPSGPVSVFNRVKLDSATEDSHQRLSRLVSCMKFSVKRQGTPALHHTWNQLQVTVGDVRLDFEPAPPVNVPLPVKLTSTTKLENSDKLVSTPKLSALSELSHDMEQSAAAGKVSSPSRSSQEAVKKKKEKEKVREKENQENMKSVADSEHVTSKTPKGQRTINQFFLPRRSLIEHNKCLESPSKNKRKRISCDLDLVESPQKKACVDPTNGADNSSLDHTYETIDADDSSLNDTDGGNESNLDNSFCTNEADDSSISDTNNETNDSSVEDNEASAKRPSSGLLLTPPVDETLDTSSTHDHEISFPDKFTKTSRLLLDENKLVSNAIGIIVENSGSSQFKRMKKIKNGSQTSSDESLQDEVTASPEKPNRNSLQKVTNKSQAEDDATEDDTTNDDCNTQNDHVKTDEVKIQNCFVCQFCRISFSNFVTWKQHESSHRSGFRCAMCDMKFVSQKILSKHMKEKHTGKDEADGEEGYQCALCDTSVKSKRGLKIHMARLHGAKDEVESEENDDILPILKKSARKSSAALSIVSNEDHDAYKCDLCPAIFISKGAVMYHMKSEHGSSVSESSAEALHQYFKNNSPKKGSGCVPWEDSSDEEVSLSETMKDKLANIMKDWEDSNDGI